MASLPFIEMWENSFSSNNVEKYTCWSHLFLFFFYLLISLLFLSILQCFIIRFNFYSTWLANRARWSPKKRSRELLWRKMVGKIKEPDEKLITFFKEKRDSALTSEAVSTWLNVVLILNENELHFYILRNKIQLQMLRSTITSWSSRKSAWKNGFPGYERDVREGEECCQCLKCSKVMDLRRILEGWEPILVKSEKEKQVKAIKDFTKIWL